MSHIMEGRALTRTGNMAVTMENPGKLDQPSMYMSIFSRSHAPGLGRVYCNTDIRLQVIPVTDPGKRHWKRTLDSQASPSSLSYNQPSHQLPTHLRLLPLQNVSIPLLSLTRAK
jgi:hypothetical protein